MPSPFEGLLQPPASTFQLYQSSVNQAETQQRLGLAQQEMQQRQQALSEQIMARKERLSQENAQLGVEWAKAAASIKTPEGLAAFRATVEPIARNRNIPMDWAAMGGAVGQNAAELERERQIESGKMDIAAYGHGLIPAPPTEPQAQPGSAEAALPFQALPPPDNLIGGRYVPNPQFKPEQERNLGDYSVVEALMKNQNMTFQEATDWVDKRRRLGWKVDLVTDRLGRTMAYVLDQTGKTVEQIPIGRSQVESAAPKPTLRFNPSTGRLEPIQ